MFRESSGTRRGGGGLYKKKMNPIPAVGSLIKKTLGGDNKARSRPHQVATFKAQ